MVGITIVVGGFEMEEDPKNVSSADNVPRKEPKRRSRESRAYRSVG